ncbi:S1 RNA-binding domain-containing protein [Streptomyces sp. URMC 129]|uniref:S1 RNA-binding domain-containing protein n=1 Tax=Streptomyces sp. URMC 129 TaxID=3423407 RepID=UPI003F1B02FA
MTAGGDPAGLLSPELRRRLEEPLAGVTDPGLLVLAAALCTPPLVPYRLLRRMRRALLPPGTLGVEGVLCSAWFVESAAADGFALDPGFVTALRGRLRRALADDGLAADREALRGLIEDETAALAPLLRLEESLCWAYVTEPDFGPVVNRILTRVVHSVARDHRTRILTWVAGAFSRLPADVFTGSAAWVLAQLCGAAGLPRPKLDWPAGGVDDELLHDAMALLPDTLLGLHRDGETLEIGLIGGRRRVAIPVPAVTPKLVTVVRHGAEPVTTRMVVDLSTGPVRVPTGRAAVDIRDMSGRVYRLAEFAADTETAPEDADVAETLAELDRRWRARQTFAADVTRVLPSGKGLIVSFPEFPGCTALLPASRAHVRQALSQLVDRRVRVRVINMDRPLQRVVVERVPGQWSSGTLQVGTRFRGPVTNKVSFGVFVSFAEAAGLEEIDFDGPRLDGLVHRTELEWSHEWSDAREFPVELGDLVDVHVLDIDAERQRVTLSFKRTRPDPWDVTLSRVHVGDRITGPVVRVLPFGWFVRVAEGVDALLHPSEAPEGSEFPVGSEISCWVLAVDPERRRISLTLRPPPWPDAA